MSGNKISFLNYFVFAEENSYVTLKRLKIDKQK